MIFYVIVFPLAIFYNDDVRIKQDHVKTIILDHIIGEWNFIVQASAKQYFTIMTFVYKTGSFHAKHFNITDST